MGGLYPSCIPRGIIIGGRIPIIGGAPLEPIRIGGCCCIPGIIGGRVGMPIAGGGIATFGGFGGPAVNGFCWIFPAL